MQHAPNFVVPATSSRHILVDGEGQPKVLNFGWPSERDAQAPRALACSSFHSRVPAPEQVSGGTISAATDVYALGVILYELVSGNLPYRFAQDDLRATAEAITGQHAARLEQAITEGTSQDTELRLSHRSTDLRAFKRFVKGDLSRIVQTALAKEPPRRYASVLAFASDLGRFLEGRTVSVSGDTLVYRARKYIGRNRWSVVMACVAALALAAGITGVLLQTEKARASAVRAGAEAKRANYERARAESESGMRESAGIPASLFAEASPRATTARRPRCGKYWTAAGSALRVNLPASRKCAWR